MMIVGAAIVLLSVNARLALYAALAMPPIALLAWFFAHRLFPISRLVQARKGNLAEATDEAVVGIEMVQAFGRERTMSHPLPRPGRGGSARDDARRRPVEAHFLPGLLFLPRSGSPPCSSSAAAT
jgi:ABC-type multidrug transport system fused ATPase/permease subunit